MSNVSFHSGFSSGLVMATAIILAVVVMLVSVDPIADFVDRHPTVKMLALSCLLLIGVALGAAGLDQHIPRGYIYFALGFSVFVEMLNQRVQKRVEPVALRHSVSGEHPGVTAPRKAVRRR